MYRVKVSRALEGRISADFGFRDFRGGVGRVQETSEKGSRKPLDASAAVGRGDVWGGSSDGLAGAFLANLVCEGGSQGVRACCSHDSVNGGV